MSNQSIQNNVTERLNRGNEPRRAGVAVRYRGIGRQGWRFAWRVVCFMLALSVLLNSFSFTVDGMTSPASIAAAEAENVEPSIEISGDAELDGEAAAQAEAPLGEDDYVYDLLGEKTVLLSRIFEACELPVPMQDVDMVVLPGGDETAEASELVDIKALRDEFDRICDYEITALQSFEQASLSVYVGDQIYTLTLINEIWIIDDADLSGDDDDFDDTAADAADGTYAFSFGGSGRVNLSDILAACGMPIGLGDVEMLGQPGGDSDAPISVERQGADYGISVLEPFDEARLAVYTANDLYTLLLLDGRPEPEATPEPAAAQEPEAAPEPVAAQESSEEPEEIDAPREEQTEVGDETADEGENEEEQTGVDSEEISEIVDEAPEEIELDALPEGIEGSEGSEDADGTDGAEDADASAGDGLIQDPTLIVLTNDGLMQAASVEDGPDGDQSEGAERYDGGYLRLSLEGDETARASLRPVVIDTADYIQLLEAYDIVSGESCEGIAAALYRVPELAPGEYLALYGIRDGALSDAPIASNMEISDRAVVPVGAWEGFALARLGLTAYQRLAPVSMGRSLIELSGALPVGAAVSVEPAIDPEAGEDALLVCDISILDGAGNAFEPLPGQPIDITVHSPAVLAANRAGSALSVSGYADALSDEAPVVAAEGDAVTFAAERCAVYAVREIVLEKAQTASDGSTYRIRVAYDTASGIPADAALEVSEIPQGGEAYADYVARSLETLGEAPWNLALARAFDIALRNPVTGEEYQPSREVRVTIELLAGAPAKAALDVVHFGGSAEVMDCDVSGQTVTFDTDGFSVYVLVATVDMEEIVAGYTLNTDGSDENRSVLLSAVLEALGLPREEGSEEVIGIRDIVDAEVTDAGENPPLSITPVDGDWQLTVAEPFDIPRTLSLTLSGESAARVSIDLTAYRAYTVTWKNDDGTVLGTTAVRSGERPEYAGEEPVKEETAQYTYTFSGWEPAITEETTVTGDTEYTARYSETLRTYSVVWKNVDGATLETDTDVPYGTAPEYNGETPTRSADSAHSVYEFIGWSPAITGETVVTGDTVFTARYTYAAMQLRAVDEGTARTEIIGATFTLTNDETGVQVWSGTSGVDDMYIYHVEEETENGQGAVLANGSTYTVRQTATDNAHFRPLGSWTLKVSDTGRLSMTANGQGSFDLSTIATGLANEIRFDIINRKAGFITYAYNYPEGVEAAEPAPQTVKLSFLSYGEDYTVGVIDVERTPAEMLETVTDDALGTFLVTDVLSDQIVRVADPDLSDEGYELVGWVDDGGAAWKTGDTASPDTMGTKHHHMTATWRVPLKVNVYSYTDGDPDSAAPVGDARDVIFATAERNRSFTSLAELGRAFGNEFNEAVKPVTGDANYGFTFATLTNPASAEPIRIRSMSYNVTRHRWEYQAEGGAETLPLAVGDVLNLYYTSNMVSVRWVRDTGSGLELLDEGSFAVGSDRWYTADDLFGQLYPDNGNARIESVVYGNCFFHYFGIGPADAADVGSLSYSGLADFALRNTDTGFRYRAGASGDGENVSGALYLVYSEEIPEGSVRLDIENNTEYAYLINELRVGNAGILPLHKALIQTETGLRLFDGATGSQWTEGLHAALDVAANTVARLILLDSEEKAFILDGGFTGTQAAEDTYRVSVGVASGSGNVILRKLMYRKSALGNELTDTKGVTKGTLDPRSGNTYVVFDPMPENVLTVRKVWSDDINPTNYRADVSLYEIWPRDGVLPEEIPLSDQTTESSAAGVLRDQGYRVMKSLNPDLSSGYYRLTKDTRAGADGWGYEISNLPSGHLYFAVESSVVIGNSTAEQIGRFERSYAASVSPNEVTVTNRRADDICRVWDEDDNEYVLCKTLNEAVAYITDHNTAGVIEMIQDYIVPESDAVTFPAGLDIRLTTAAGIQNLTTAVIRRGFNGGDLFDVAGSLALDNLTLDAKIENTYFANTGNGGFARVENGAMLTVGDGVTMQNGRAVNGSAVFVENGGTVSFTGGRVQNNYVTGTGGAIGVGGTAARVNLSGDVVIYNNHRVSNGSQFNLCLNQDSNEVIQVTGTLSGGAHVGVYVTDAANDAHGKPAKPFATYAAGLNNDSLNKLTNDRFKSGSAGSYGYASRILSGNIAVWGETFSFTARVQWLNADYEVIGAPSGAVATLTLNTVSGGTTQTDMSVTVTGAGSVAFAGLAKYDSDGNAAKYRITESNIAPSDYEQISFYGDRAIKANGSFGIVDDSPLVYSPGYGDGQIVTVSNKYRYTTFTVTKKPEGIPDGVELRSTFEIKRIRKYGVGSAYDLPNGLRQATVPEAWANAALKADDQQVTVEKTTGFFTLYGGNSWYCQVAQEQVLGADLKQGIENNPHLTHLVRFNRFYDLTRISADPAYVSGDVKYDGTTYSVYDGASWYALSYTADSHRPDVRIDYSRQDGSKGADRVASRYSVESAGSVTINTVGDTPATYTLTVDSNHLPSDYYYYAVETAVNGNGKSISGSAPLISVYNPLYVYNQAERSVEVTNTDRQVLAVQKVWDTDGPRVSCTFNVYKITRDNVSLSNSEQFREMVEDKRINGEDLGDPVLTFSLPDDAADDRASSLVHVVKASDLGDEYDPDAVYFAREVTANGIPVESHGVVDNGADAVYAYSPVPNLITVTNVGAPICKVLDSDGEHPFRKLRDAYKFGINDRILSNDEFTIEMLVDYTIPSGDTLTIEPGKRVTLTTAATSGGVYNYSNSKGGTRATITRGNMSAAFITVTGNNDSNRVGNTQLILRNIAFEGNNTAVGSNGGLVTASNYPTVKLEGTSPDNGVVMKGGVANNGGAIYMDTGDLTLEYAAFEGCKSQSASNEAYGGGAIHSKGEKLELENSSFTKCEARSSGGAVYHNNAKAAETRISQCVFRQCSTADNASKAGGGAVDSKALLLTIEGTKSNYTLFENCTSARSGGGVFHNNDGVSTANLKYCKFDTCTSASSADKEGTGGLLSKAKYLTMTGCQFVSCSGHKQGGAVHQNRTDAGSKLWVEDCSFRYCQAIGNDSAAGAMESDVYTIDIINSEFYKCNAGSNGGAVNIYAGNGDNKNDATTVTVNGCTFTDCYITTVTDKRGGGVRSTAKETYIINSDFIKGDDENAVGCKGVNGGGVFSQNNNVGSKTVIQGCLFDGCEATVNYGGGVYTNSRTVQVEGFTGLDVKTGKNITRKTEFKNCTAKNTGGGLYHANTNGSKVTIEDCVFDNCKTLSSGNKFGGGVYTDAVEVEVRRTAFKDCLAMSSGGGLYYGNTNGKLIVEDNISFTTCTSSGGSGGGIWTSAKTVGTADNPIVASFDTCKADSGNGGGMCVANGNNVLVVLNNSIFKNCTAKSNGGGLTTSGLTTSIMNCRFTSCETISSADDNTGGGAVSTTNNTADSLTQIQGCIFSGCVSAKMGGAVYSSNKVLRINGDKQTEFIDSCHSASTGGAVCHNRNMAESLTQIENCLFDACYVSEDKSGGAVYSIAMDIKLLNDRFDGCYSGDWGGAVNHSNSNATLTEIKNCEFLNCYTRKDEGGGLRSNTKQVELTETSFTGCYTLASNGGGLSYGHTSGILKVNSCDFIACHAAAHGGGIYTTAKEAEINNGSAFRNCYAEQYGGGINFNSDVADTVNILTDVTLEDCYAKTHEGGGIRSIGRTATLTRVTFTNCYSEGTGGDGGGGFSYGKSKDIGAATLDGCTFTGCYCNSAKNGGAILQKGKTLIVKNGTVINGTVSNPDVTFNANNGGGIFSSYAEVEIEDSEIRNCIAKSSGGAFYQDNNSASRNATLTGVTLTGNSAKGTENSMGGGAIFFKPISILTLDACTVSDNRSDSRGGGIYYYGNNTGTNSANLKLVLVNGTSITGNRISGTNIENAAGLYMLDRALLVIGDVNRKDETEYTETITIYDNFTENNVQSNLRIMRSSYKSGNVNEWRNMNGSTPDITLYADLSHEDGTNTGLIGVCNPGDPNTRFGLSDHENHTGVENFIGITEEFTMKGIIDTSSKDVIKWYIAPVCRIMDASGEELLTYGDDKIAAEFYTLRAAIEAYNVMTEGYFGGGVPGQIQMLVTDYTLNQVTPDFERDCVLTTAPEVGTCTIVRGDGNTDSMLKVSSKQVEGSYISLTVQKLVLDGGYRPEDEEPLKGQESGGIVRVRSGATLILEQDAVLRNSVLAESRDGGAVYLDRMARMDMQSNAQIVDCASGRDGGGVYLNAGSAMKMVGFAGIEGCEAQRNGGAVYVLNSASLTLGERAGDLPVIRNNHVTDGDGAGIYLNGANSRLYMREKIIFSQEQEDNPTAPSFSDQNTKTGAIKNGGKSYESTRQDIYLDFNSASAAQNIVLTGDLRSQEGSVWVWALSSEHFLLNRQFAVIEEGVTVSDATLQTFRDAVDDTTAENRTGQYYTGVRGENETYVYWGVPGVDFRFKKIDGSGETSLALAGAVFSLYRDAAGLDPVLRGEEPVTATVADGTDAYKNAAGDTLTLGEVLFERIPVGVYYMKETTLPEHYTNAMWQNAEGEDVPDMYIVVVGSALFEDADTRMNEWAAGKPLSDITRETLNAQIRLEGEEEDRQFAIFLYDAATDKALTSPDIARYGVMNYADRHKVVLKKVERGSDDTQPPLSGATFDILRFDRMVVAGDVTSGANGLIWIGRLPEGTYYLHEKTVPAGHQKLDETEDNWYRLIVDEGGAQAPTRLTAAP